MLPWKSIINIDRKSDVPVYIQVVNAFIREITFGRLNPGQKLPGTRAIAKELSLNRKTLVIIYDELMAQGWIDIRPSQGAFVSELLPIPKYKKLPKDTKPEIPGDAGFPIEHNEVIKVYRYPKKYSLELNDGTPDDRIAPLDELFKRAGRIAQDEKLRKLRHYTDIQGEGSLRVALADYLRQTRGLVCTPENLLITRGSQMALYLILNTLINPGDQVVVGDTNYPVVNQIIETVGGEINEVSIDDKGISISELRSLTEKKKIRLIFITPHHHFPTTVTLSAERRVALLSIAEQHKIAVIEDDYDYDFHYASGPLLPLASLDNKGLVVYVGSFSKLMAPSVRIGYLVAPVNLISELNKLRKVMDRQGDTFLERALGSMISSGEVTRHQKKALKIYKERRDLFCKLLKEQFGNKIDFKLPRGGMAVWAKFNRGIPLHLIKERLLEKGIFCTLDLDFLEKHHGVRLGFASLSLPEIRKVIGVLGEVLN